MVRRIFLAVSDIFQILLHPTSNFGVKVQIAKTVLQLKFLRRKQSNMHLSLNLFGVKMRIIDPSDTQFMLKELWLEQPYKIVEDHSINHIVDVGANQGFSMLYFRKSHPNARITAIEMDPDNFKILQENVRQMTVKGDELLNKAAWKADSVLYLNTEEKTATTNRSVNDENKVGLPVMAFDFGKWLKQNAADIVKIDIEGAEIEVLESIWSAEAMYCSKHWLLEFHTERLGQTLHEKAIANFTKAGFSYENRGIVGYFYKVN